MIPKDGDHPVIETVAVKRESEPEARVCDYAWVIDMHMQCVEYNVGFHYHQTGAREQGVQHSQRTSTYAGYGCWEHQLEFDAINDNLPEIVEMYGINSRKITCDNYIDDNAVLPAILNT